MTQAATLTLGPLLFNWPAERWTDFYARIADEAPVDRVCLGEVVCSKRLPFYADRLLDAAERLRRGGKKAVLSSLALVTLKRERQLSADLVAAGDFDIEVNDLTLLRLLPKGRPFTVGPFVNVYNEETLAYLAGRGARRICLPPELPLSSIAVLAEAAAPLGTDLEVWAFGRVPLALSGRCYHARIHGLSKDNCQFVCDRDSDGLKVETLDGEDFLAVNGIQTLSFTYGNLLADLADLRAEGLRSFRLSPHDCDMVAVSRLFADVAADRRESRDAEAELAALCPGAAFSNGFLRGVPGAERIAAG